MKNNKGFSLVELIIVIAIMAILVGVMAPQLIKYIEKTNISSDTQLCDSVRTAIITASLDPDVAKVAGAEFPDSTGASVNVSTSNSATSIAEEILGISLSAVDGKLKSKTASQAGKNVYYVKSGNNVKVYVNGTDIQSGN